MLFSRKKLKPAERALFLRQLAILCGNGLSLTEAIQKLAQNNESPPVKAYCRYLMERQQGLNSEEKEGSLFEGTLLARLSDKAEDPGIFAEALDELADVNETTAHYSSSLSSVLFYPAIILGTSIMLCAVLLIFVIPVFEEMFSDFGASLPASTMRVLVISHWLKEYFVFLVLAFLLVVWGCRLLPEARLPIFWLVPGLGKVVKDVTAIHFSHLFSALLKFGFPLPEAFQISVQSMTPTVYGRRLKRLEDTFNDLEGLKSEFKKSAVFPVSTMALIDIAESPDILAQSFAGLSKYLRKNFDNQLGKTFRVMEVMAIIFVGIIVGGLVISMYLPIFKMAGAVG